MGMIMTRCRRQALTMQPQRSFADRDMGSVATGGLLVSSVSSGIQDVEKANNAVYESLYGYPPFVSSSRHITRQKMSAIYAMPQQLQLTCSLNWKTTLKFPPKPRLSPPCLDLMTRLLCEPEDRIGSSPAQISVLSSRNGTLRGASGFVGFGKDGAEEIMRHPWFEGIDWDSESTCPSIETIRSRCQICTRWKHRINPN